MPEYEKINLQDQANKAGDLLLSNQGEAYQIAMGIKPPPEGLRALAVFKAVEKRAFAQGDVEMIRDLATQSTVNQELSTAAQTVGLARGRDTGSPVDAISEVNKVREDMAKKRNPKVKEATDAEVKTAKEHISKAIPKESWVSFVNSIRCK